MQLERGFTGTRKHSEVDKGLTREPAAQQLCITGLSHLGIRQISFLVIGAKEKVKESWKEKQSPDFISAWICWAMGSTLNFWVSIKK